MTSRRLSSSQPSEQRLERRTRDRTRSPPLPRRRNESLSTSGTHRMLLEPAPGDSQSRCRRYNTSRPSAFSWTREECASASRLMRGTRLVPYRAVYDNDRIPGRSSSRSLVGVRMHSITAMPFYESRSFEELRLEDTRPHNSCSIGDRMVSTSTLSKIVVLGSSSAGNDEKKHTLPAVDEAKEERSCVICLDNRRTIAFFPCKHMCTCLPCSRNRRLVKCPICREEIVLKTTIYW
mmetsp:Transcript_18414/g.40110  ORF Transcript_18414/g.40110 Transcript_18414/m.40110 type:complete len:235 (+) Transcript_18414:389-1093(+)